jgi:hypothetical protein
LLRNWVTDRLGFGGTLSASQEFAAVKTAARFQGSFLFLFAVHVQGASAAAGRAARLGPRNRRETCNKQKKRKQSAPGGFGGRQGDGGTCGWEGRGEGDRQVCQIAIKSAGRRRQPAGDAEGGQALANVISDRHP